jgi:D-alanyl-D-alanine carboxypeptidase/D-alanyl-D-alanine-endopeptidase (penicillin-binding protein 4)
VRNTSRPAIACFRTLAFLLAAGLWTGPTAAASGGDDELPPTVARALARAQIPESAIGLLVERVGAVARPVQASGSNGIVAASRVVQPLLVVNADQPMNPASTMKLVTTYAALELLGPAFTWKTTLSSSGTIRGSVLDGDLYLRGAGDPKLVFEHLWLMLRQLRGRGVKSIDGDLVFDRTLFQPQPYDPGAFDGEPSRPYNVGPDALLLNYKAVTLRFMPDDAHREVRVTMEPPLADVALGPLAYADGPCGDWRARTNPDFGRDRIAFGGVYAGSCGEQTWNVALLDHRQFDGALFRSLWTELGGSLSGVVRDGATPLDARVLAEHESAGLAEVIRDINKYSNNVMARELFLSTAAEVTKMPASAERAQEVVRSFYALRGLALPDLVIDNGSGLSRRERISARSMGAILETAWTSALMPEFISSLPLVGFDGTMKRRLNQQSVAGQAHVKTGTLADVRAVAGYVLAASGKTYVIVLFVNHPNAAGAQAAQDALLQWIYERG